MVLTHPMSKRTCEHCIHRGPIYVHFAADSVGDAITLCRFKPDPIIKKLRDRCAQGEWRLPHPMGEHIPPFIVMINSPESIELPDPQPQQRAPAPKPKPVPVMREAPLQVVETDPLWAEMVASGAITTGDQNA